MLNSAKPYLITGKNTNTNLSSIHSPPPPPPELTDVRFSSVPYYWKPPRSGTPTLLGESTNINNTIKWCLLKPRANNLMYLCCLTQENYPGLSKKTKDKLPLAKSKSRQTTAARLALCARPYFSVFFPPAFVKSQMAQVARLRILERGVLGLSSLSCWSFVVVFPFFFFQNEDFENSKSFHRVAEGEFNTNKSLLKEDFNTNKTLVKGENYTPLNSP